MTTTTKAQTQMQNNTAVIDLMSFVPGKEPVTSLYHLFSKYSDREYEEVVHWNPERMTVEELNDFVFGKFTRFERVETLQEVYVLVNEEGRMLARRGGRDFWALPPWQYDRFSNFQGGVYDSRLYLEPVMRKTERAMRQHQERVGGRVVKMTFGAHTNHAPVKVVFLP